MCAIGVHERVEKRMEDSLAGRLTLHPELPRLRSGKTRHLALLLPTRNSEMNQTTRPHCGDQSAEKRQPKPKGAQQSFYENVRTICVDVDATSSARSFASPAHIRLTLLRVPRREVLVECVREA